MTSVSIFQNVTKASSFDLMSRVNMADTDLVSLNPGSLQGLMLKVLLTVVLSGHMVSFHGLLNILYPTSS